MPRNRVAVSWDDIKHLPGMLLFMFGVELTLVGFQDLLERSEVWPDCPADPLLWPIVGFENERGHVAFGMSDELAHFLAYNTCEGTS